MPWTFAHPAAILPLRRFCPRWLSLPALILGAMSPDLTYHVALFEWALFCHTPQGVLTGCLPLGLALLALLQHWHRPLTVLLPAPHRRLFRTELQPAAGFVRWLAVAVLSLLVGAATHVVWDSFTHTGRWGEQLLPGLNTPLIHLPEGQKFRIFNLLQHLSTVFGLTVLALAYRRSLRRQSPAPATAHDAQRARLLLAGLAGALVVGASLAWLATPDAYRRAISPLVVNIVICSTSTFLLFFVAGSLAWWQRRGDDA